MEKSKYAFPTINLKEIGINLRRIVGKRGITPKDVKEYLNLTSVQSVYNWCSARITAPQGVSIRKKLCHMMRQGVRVKCKIGGRKMDI